MPTASLIVPVRPLAWLALAPLLALALALLCLLRLCVLRLLLLLVALLPFFEREEPLPERDELLRERLAPCDFDEPLARVLGLPAPLLEAALFDALLLDEPLFDAPLREEPLRVVLLFVLPPLELDLLLAIPLPSGEIRFRGATTPAHRG